MLSDKILLRRFLAVSINMLLALLFTALIRLDNEMVSVLFNLIAFKLSIPFWRHALVDRVVVSKALRGNTILPFLSAVTPFTLNTSLPEVSAKFRSLSFVKLAKFNR